MHIPDWHLQNPNFHCFQSLKQTGDIKMKYLQLLVIYTSGNKNMILPEIQSNISGVGT